MSSMSPIGGEAAGPQTAPEYVNPQAVPSAITKLQRIAETDLATITGPQQLATNLLGAAAALRTLVQKKGVVDGNEPQSEQWHAPLIYRRILEGEAPGGHPLELDVFERHFGATLMVHNLGYFPEEHPNTIARINFSSDNILRNLISSRANGQQPAQYQRPGAYFFNEHGDHKIWRPLHSQEGDGTHRNYFAAAQYFTRLLVETA